MMGHADPLFILGRCGDTLDSSGVYVCLPTLPDCREDDTLVDTSDLNALPARQDVLDTFEGDRQTYGISTYPDYRIRLEFEEGGERLSLSIGRSCDGADDCIPIPEGVQALKDRLDAIVYNLSDYGLAEGPQCEYHNYQI